MISTYDSTVSMMRDLKESDLLVIKEFVKRLMSKTEERREMYSPYKQFTREEIIEQLAIAKEHAQAGMVVDAKRASASVREKYGL